MNHALTLRPVIPSRFLILLMISVVLWIASAIGSVSPLAISAGKASHDQICNCVHCRGGAACCCRQSGKCFTP